MIGQRFNRWTVISETDERRNRKLVYVCRCDCGSERSVCAGNLRSGISKSCGCLKLERIHDTKFLHGRGTKDPTYLTWSAMRARCSNPKASNFSRYGGRGIAVCARWNSFEVFLADMGERPSRKHTIDRKDNELGYQPSNCRWATSSEQARNKRKTQTQRAA